MRRFLDIAVPVIIAFIVSLVLQTLLTYLSRESGSVSLISDFAIDGIRYDSISISNYSNEPIDGLLVSVPTTTIITMTLSSAPVQISDMPNNVAAAQSKLINISSIIPNHVTQILVPVSGSGADQATKILNAEQLNLAELPTADITYPYITIVPLVLLNSIIVAFFTGVFMYYVDRQARKMESELELLKIDLSKSREQLDLLTKAISSNLRITASRLSDYSKELDFWHDTVRKLLYNVKHEYRVSDKLIKTVTETLGTYQTLGKLEVESDFVKLVMKQLLDMLTETNAQELDNNRQ